MQAEFDGAPEDLAGQRVLWNGSDSGTVIADWFGERVKVAFDDGTTQYVPRTGLTITHDAGRFA